MAAPKINHTEFTLNPNIAMTLTNRIETVSQSVIEAFPNCQATTAISASDPTTPSNTAPAAGERRSLGAGHENSESRDNRARQAA
jgi:hypothetical protein